MLIAVLRAKRLPVILAGLAFVVSARPDVAGAETIRSSLVVGGPVLSPAGLIWAEETLSHALRIQLRTSGGERRTLYRAPLPNDLFPPAYSGAAVSIQHGVSGFSASGGWLAFERTITEAHQACPACARSSSDPIVVIGAGEFLAGPLAGPYERLAGATASERCEDQGGVGDVELEGSIVAYSENVEACPGQPADLRVVVRDLADAARPPRIFGHISSGPGEVALRGPLVAWVPSIELVGQFTATVADWATGEVILRVNPPNDIRVDDLALDDSGRLFFTYTVKRGSVERERLAWSSAADPTVHDILEVEQIGALRIAGRWVAYVRGHRSDDVTLPDPKDQELVAHRLGQPPRLIARFRGRRELLGEPDLDGSRIAWASARRDPSHRHRFLDRLRRPKIRVVALR